MTDKELRKLNRAELIDILIYLETELEKANAEVEKLKSKLDDNTKKTHNILDALKVINNNVKLLCKNSLISPEDIPDPDFDSGIKETKMEKSVEADEIKLKSLSGTEKAGKRVIDKGDISFKK
ncbi:MAG: hypothetical protein ACI4RC_01485 [Oscillospiraceae bacterium]